MSKEEAEYIFSGINEPTYKELQQENKQLKSILTELEDYLRLGICEPAYIKGDMFWQNACEEFLDKIQELKEKYK